MNIFSKIVEVASGGLGSKLIDVATSYFPPSMTDEQKENFALKVQQLEAERAREVDLAVSEAQQNMTDQIAKLEGTANDLKTIPVLGPLMLFLRGCQRPVWGFFTIYLDCHWLIAGASSLTEQQQSAMIVINVLVLGFLFGERAVKNIMPLIIQSIKSKGS